MKIHTTTNHDKFLFINGNRPVNTAHVNRIKHSIEKNGYLFNVLIVNENMEIIDGQHRHAALKDLNLPVYYTVKNGYSLKHVQVYNQDSKNWSYDDFMNCYIKLGLKEYEIYKYFKAKHGFGHRETTTLLTSGVDSGGGKNMQQFKEGKFKIKSYSKAEETANKIHDFAEFYENYKRRWFVMAVIRLVRRNGEYNHRQMLNKLSFQSAKLTDQSSVNDYLSILEKIYNFRTRDDYVRFDIAA